MALASNGSGDALVDQGTGINEERHAALCGRAEVVSPRLCLTAIPSDNVGFSRIEL